LKLLLPTTFYSPNAAVGEIPDVETFIAESNEQALEYAPEMDAAFQFSSEKFVNAAPNLRWIQTLSAGINNLPFQLLLDRGISVTNAATVYGPNMADHSLGLMLTLSRQLRVIDRYQAEHGWMKDKPRPVPGELHGQTLLIVGLGGIGLETARRAAAFGMKIIATRRHTDRPVPDFVDELHPPEALHDLLSRADWVDICVPLIPQTKDLIHDREFELMKDGAYLICVTRGGIINNDAMVRAIESGKLSGVGLDATQPEPLPADHPLWGFQNVIITPHASGQAKAAFDRLEKICVDNIHSFLAGEKLQNIVHLDLQY
jgi:phosphoglycerate dehydrogenase-like enzyme